MISRQFIIRPRYIEQPRKELVDRLTEADQAADPSGVCEK